MVHLGDDTDDRISPAELATNPYTPADDAAAGARRKEGILVHLPRVQANVVAIAFAVTSYTDEMGLAEAAGAEMRLCVGPTHSSGMTKRATSPYKSPISSPKEPYILPQRALYPPPQRPADASNCAQGSTTISSATCYRASATRPPRPACSCVTSGPRAVNI